MMNRWASSTARAARFGISAAGRLAPASGIALTMGVVLAETAGVDRFASHDAAHSTATAMAVPIGRLRLVMCRRLHHEMRQLRSSLSHAVAGSDGRAAATCT